MISFRYAFNIVNIEVNSLTYDVVIAERARVVVEEPGVDASTVELVRTRQDS